MTDVQTDEQSRSNCELSLGSTALRSPTEDILYLRTDYRRHPASHSDGLQLRERASITMAWGGRNGRRTGDQEVASSIPGHSHSRNSNRPRGWTDHSTAVRL